MSAKTPSAASADVPRELQILRGQTQGVMVLAGAALGWVMIGLSALGPVPIWVIPMAFTAPVILLLGSIALRKATVAIPDIEWSPAVNRTFWYACIGEAVGIVTIFVVAPLLHHKESALPAMAVPIGLHFIPLAIVYKRPLYFLTAVMLCLVGVISVTSFPVSAVAHPINAQLLAAGVSGGIVLWVTAAVMLIQSWAGLKVRPLGR